PTPSTPPIPTGDRSESGLTVPGPTTTRISQRSPESPAPAGWPDDVLRATGRTSPVASPPGGPRTRLGVRRPPIVRQAPGTRSHPTVREPPAPWPGRIPAPSPATVPPQPLPAELLDSTGAAVLLTAPDLLSAAPHEVVVARGRPRAVRGWAGPWPVEQRWWTADTFDGSWVQLVCDDGEALLLLVREDRWWVVGVYD
ncbi:MAG: hypothetical protein ACT4RN_10055, partial [Pseudonocardia sp.]